MQRVDFQSLPGETVCGTVAYGEAQSVGATGPVEMAGILASGGESSFVEEAGGTTGKDLAVEGGTTVYRAVENGVTRYVGITKRLATRYAEHFREKGIRIQEIPGLSNLSPSDARAVEQVLIENYGLEKFGGTLINQINSIAASNPIYEKAIERGVEILQRIHFEGF